MCERLSRVQPSLGGGLTGMRLLIVRRGDRYVIAVLRPIDDTTDDVHGKVFRRLSHRAWGYIRREMRKEAE